MNQLIVKKSSILIPSGTDFEPEKKHLFFVCTDICNNGFHLLVPLATWQNELCDNTCRLAKHDHPFIDKASYILYRKSRIEAGQLISQKIENGIFVLREPVNAPTFLRISNGICKSPQTPRKIKVYANC